MVYLVILTIIIFIVAVYFCVRLLAMKNAIKKANDELAEIMENIEENRIVKLSTPSRDVEKLLVTINTLLEQIRQKAIDYKVGEKRLKKEVESISHDLRTPLTSLLGYLKLIDGERLSSNDMASLETVRQKAYALQRLITQFYDLSRISGRNYALNIESVDISRFLREHITSQYALLTERSLEVSVTIPDEPIIVQADINALERIIHNLLHNAGKYAKSKFSVSLMTEGNQVLAIFENDTDETGNSQSGDIENTRLGLLISGHLADGMNAALDVDVETQGESRWFRVRLALNAV